MGKSGEVIAGTRRETVKLNKKDKEIINILTYNSRTPLSQIAKYLKTSTEVVAYHYNNLIKKNIITDTFAIINLMPLGVHRYCFYLQFHALSQQKMKLIINDFLQNKYIYWVIESGGRWEILLNIETLYEEKYDKILESVVIPIKDYLSSYTVTVVKNFMHKPPRFIEGFKLKEEYVGKIRFPYEKQLDGGKGKSYVMDEKDVMLLKNIHQNSRLSLREMGRRLALSRDAVDYRIKKLIGCGLITGFIIRLNYHLLDVQYTSIMLKFRSVTEERKNNFYSYIYQDRRFWAVFEQIGEWDALLMMFFVNAKDLRDFLISIKEKFSDVIHSHDSVIHFDQYYYSYLCDGIVEELLARCRKKPVSEKFN